MNFLPGVFSCEVNLDDENAIVIYNPTVIISEDIRLAIEDMGFDATVAGKFVMLGIIFNDIVNGIY